MELDNNIYDGLNDINQKELEAAEDFEGNKDRISGQVVDLCSRFPIYQ